MAGPSVTMRCPTCGLDVTAVVAPAPPTQWFPCPRCHAPVPVVVRRDLPPLYTWEVVPGLYPTFPPPRPPRWSARRATALALLAVVVLSITFGGLLSYYGAVALGPASYTVSGTVWAERVPGGTVPASGARVVLTEDGGGRFSQLSAVDGSFRFEGVPAGGDTLNITMTGYAPVEVDTFASPVYNAGTEGITVTLVPGGVANGTTIVLSAFPDLETFLASIGSAVALFGIVAIVSGFAAVLTLRQDRPALGVVGGGAGLSVPFVFFFLGLAPVFPLAVAASASLAAFGAFALAVRAIELLQTGPAADSG